MNRSQINSQTMATSVAQTLQSNASEYAGKPVIIDAVAQHTININVIRDLAVDQLKAKEINGLIHDKNMLKFLMAFNATRIVNAISAYANQTGNKLLADSVRFTYSQLKRANDNVALAMFIKISQVATTNAASILSYGATGPMISLLTDDCISFENIIKLPKEMRGNAAQITQNLALAFKTMISHLKNILDPLIRASFMNTPFAISYFRQRITYKIGTTETSLQGTITSPDGHPIPKCYIELLNYPLAGSNTTCITNKNGFFSAKRLNANQVTARFRALNYSVAEIDIKLQFEKENVFNLQLFPIPVPVPVTV